MMTRKAVNQPNQLSQVRLLAILILLMISGAVIFINVGFYQDRLRQLRRSFEADVRHQGLTLQQLIREHQHHAMTVATVIAKMEAVELAYHMPNDSLARQVLNQAIGPIIDSWESNDDQELRKVHFHRPPARSLLRLWNQTGGDDLASFRQSILHVASTQKPLTCLELGRGGFAIRGIAPIHDAAGEYVGSVEVFFEITDLMPAIESGANGDGVVLLAEKAIVERLFFQEEQVRYDQGEIGGHIVVSQSALPSQVTHVIGTIDFDPYSDAFSLHEKGKVLVGNLQIRDFSGQLVGHVLLVRNLQAAYQEAYAEIIRMSVILLVPGLFMIGLILVFFRRIRERFSNYSNQLKLEVAQKTRINQELDQSLQLVQSAQKQAEAANKAKSEFLANMSHEDSDPDEWHHWGFGIVGYVSH